MPEIEQVEPEAVTDTEAAPARTRAPRSTTPRVVIPPQKGKAQVEIKTRYETDAPESNSTESESNKNSNQTPVVDFSRTSNGKNFSSQNRLIDLFEEIKDTEDYEGEPFMAFITRRQDLMNDTFRRLCTTAESFAPLEITSGSLMSFIPIIQKYNGNSGGRFDITITDSKGADLGIGLSGFVVPNPIIEEHSNGSDTDITKVIQVISEQNRATEARFEKLVATLAEPKPDAFMDLVKQKMMNDFLNPPKPEKSAFDIDEFMAKAVMSTQVANTLGEKFSQTLGAKPNSPDTEKDKTTLEMILGNEMIMSRASDLLTNIFEIVGDLVAAKQQAALAQGMLPQSPNPQPQPQPEPAEDMNMKTIDEIITELESDNPITLENETLVRLAGENPALFQQLKTLAGIMQFDALFGELEKLLPEERVDKFYDSNDELNELGIKIKGRLQELFNVLTAPPPEPEKTTA